MSFTTRETMSNLTHDEQGSQQWLMSFTDRAIHIGKGVPPAVGRRTPCIPFPTKRNCTRHSRDHRVILASAVPESASSVRTSTSRVPWFGYSRNLEERYELCDELGRGGNGVVRVARNKRTGVEYACKSILKVIEDPNVSLAKRMNHANIIKNEVEVLMRLRGTLNVACIEEVFEDEYHVHIIMECCKGGELWHRIGARHYSERTVASFMRAVLRTLAQCHSHRILHRDIKPGNFMLSDEDDKAPLKAIDFGLAVFYDPNNLPRSDLGLEGTPWYMAPEVLSSKVTPASDVWSAGVMAFQLLTGRFPFNDRNNPSRPALAQVWKSILTDELDFNRSYWQGISDEAKDFVRVLLRRNPDERPTASQALDHPWLKGGRAGDRLKGKPLSFSVVQRVQRYAQSSMFKRTVLEHIAEDMVAAEVGAETFVPLASGCRPVVTPSGSPLQYLYNVLEFGDNDEVDREAVQTGLEKLGYRLDSHEASRLLDQLDPSNTGRIARSQVAASQIDWADVQSSFKDQWLNSVQRVFEEIDTNGDGVLSLEEIMNCLKQKLPCNEIDRAVKHAMQEASLHGSNHGGMDFKAFLKLLRCDSRDNLDVYDDRCGSSCGSQDQSLLAADNSIKGGNMFQQLVSRVTFYSR